VRRRAGEGSGIRKGCGVGCESGVGDRSRFERNFRDARAASVMAPGTDVLHDFVRQGGLRSSSVLTARRWVVAVALRARAETLR
jgi:hypothetical protein